MVDLHHEIFWNVHIDIRHLHWLLHMLISNSNMLRFCFVFLAIAIAVAVAVAVPWIFEGETVSCLVFHRITMALFFGTPCFNKMKFGSGLAVALWLQATILQSLLRVIEIVIAPNMETSADFKSVQKIQKGHFFPISTISDISEMTGKQNICICIWFARPRFLEFQNLSN